VLHGSLGGLLALAQGAALQSPTLLVVGEVTALGLQTAVAEQQAIKSVGERA